MCPRCGQNAPVVYRGVLAYCTACGAQRPPLTGRALHMAGQPSRIGGAVARVFGWIVLGVGLTLAVLLGLVAQALFPQGFAGLLLGVPTAVVSVVLALFLLRGGARLGKSGLDAEQRARAQAVTALAANRGGALTAMDVAQALELPLPEADALLSQMAREQYEHIAVEVDPNGTIVYRFVGAPTRVRVDPEIARSPNRAEWERLEREEAERAEVRARARR